MRAPAAAALDRLKPSQANSVRDALTAAASRDDRTLEVATLIAGGLDKPVALAVLARLEAAGALVLRRRFFHVSDACDPSRAFEHRDYRDGAPGLPCACAVCGEVIEGESEVEYETYAVLRPGGELP